MASRVSLSHLSMPSVALINTTLLNKSLSAMVKGIRGHKDRGELEYINKCIAEIKEELSTPYADVKAQALQKLIYLQVRHSHAAGSRGGCPTVRHSLLSAGLLPCPPVVCCVSDDWL